MNRVAMLLVPIIVAAASIGCAVQYQPEAPAPRYYNPHWNDASVAKHQACYDAVLDAVKQAAKQGIKVEVAQAQHALDQCLIDQGVTL